MEQSKSITVCCPSFGQDGQIPIIHTGFDKDQSPEIQIDGLTKNAVSITVLMDDLDIPCLKEYSHWVIWNLPPIGVIEGNIPYGADCPNGARQGVGYGRNRYRGPKQPPFIRKAHRYRFSIYVLDCKLELSQNSRKADLKKAMDGHILQMGECTGWYQPR